MAHAFTIIRSVAAISILLVSIIPGSVGPKSRESVRINVEAVDADSDQISVLKWALRQASTLPGRLPDLEVRFSPDDECNGNNALYNEANHRIDFCNDGSGDLVPRQTMLHELVHAWSFEHMTPEQIDAFLGLRELEEWSPGDVAWWQSGQEQVAEILAWGLMGDRPFTSKWTLWESCTDLVAAFTLVTGMMPDRPLKGCQSDTNAS